jgi:uncharacterized protein YegJ (DUF2314 family)
MILARRILGCIALAMGAALVAWFVYNQIHPTPEFQRSFRNPIQLVVPLVFLIVGWRWLRYQGPGIEETPPDLICPELDESVKQAQQTLQRFVQQVEKNVDGAFIKFPMKTKQGLTEHIWAYVHSYRDGIFNVSLVNKPIDPKEPAEGRRDVVVEQVEDWQIMQPDGCIQGAFSLIALFRYRENQGKKLSPKMKKQKAQLIDAGGS